jgi:hypothetical protein
LRTAGFGNIASLKLRSYQWIADAHDDLVAKQLGWDAEQFRHVADHDILTASGRDQYLNGLKADAIATSATYPKTLTTERCPGNEWVGIGRLIQANGATIRVVFDLEEERARTLRDRLLSGEGMYETVSDSNLILVERVGNE